MAIDKILKLSLFILIASNSFAQCKHEVVLENEFTLRLPKKYSVIKANDSLQSIQESFIGMIVNGKDTARVFISDDLYIQATLHIRQDILSIDIIDSFNIKSNDILELQEVRNIKLLKKGNKLIIIDFGPKNLKGNRPIEYYCYDFTTQKTLVINSSSSPIYWDENLSKISRRMTRKIAKSI
jgi:AAA+ ATPase superfamily predicted ATPase